MQGTAGDEVVRHLRIYGRVQGVGYRWSMVGQARALGVGGWVRNRGDGSVEALLSGPHEQVAALIHWAGCGPAGARVDEVEVEEGTAADTAALDSGFVQLQSF